MRGAADGHGPTVLRSAVANLGNVRAFQAGVVRVSSAALLAGLIAIAASMGFGDGAVPSDAIGAASAAAEEGRGEVPKPRIEFDPIPYDRDRKRQMAAYSARHYGNREWRLDPRAIVLHYTASSGYESAFNTFASNAPALGELPGVCSQFVVDKDGTIYQLTRLEVRCRHTIGLNHVSIGIELVQEDVGGGTATSEAILDRSAQARSAVQLAAWLKQRYRIPMRDVVGHATANDSRLFEDRTGWRNDHSDWPEGPLKVFRKRITREIRSAGRTAPATEAPTLTRSAFGESVEGRKLAVRRSRNADSKRTALVVGEVHGDEEAGLPIVRRLRRKLGPAAAVDLWTIGSINPDGHADDRRTNANGVDLNRNFSVDWDGSEPKGSGYYAGPEPFSEPESRAVRDLIRRIDPDVTIYYHQPWGAVLAPCDGPIPMQQLYSRVSGLGIDRCRGEDLPGTATKWQRARGETAFVVELGADPLSDSEVRRHARAAARVAGGR